LIYFLKVRGDEQSVTNWAKLFHARGPATAKVFVSKWCTTCCWHHNSGWRCRPETGSRRTRRRKCASAT